MNLEKKIAHFINWFLSRPKTSGFLVFTAFLFVLNLSIYFKFKAGKETEQSEMTNILGVVKKNIEQNLKNNYAALITLALSIDDQGQPKNFESIAEKLVSSYDNINAVQLVPNGVIKLTYPLKGNESATNFDILHSPLHRKAALKAIETKNMYFSGPMELRQSGLGVVGRLPIFKKGEFWGFSAVITKFNTFIKSTGISSYKSDKYYFQLSKVNPITNKTEFFLNDTADFSKKTFKVVDIPEGDWKLYIISKSKNVESDYLLLILLAFFLSSLCGLFTYTLLKRPAELQKLVDIQTQKIKDLIDSIDGVVWEGNSEDPGITYISKKSETILGYTPEEWVADDHFWRKIIHPEDRDWVIEYSNKYAREKKHFDHEYRMISKNGTSVWVRDIVSIYHESENVIKFRGILIDITKSKQFEIDLNNSLKLVTEQNKRLLNFSHIVSHNLRSHTSNIESLINLIEISEDEEERNEMLGLLKSVSETLSQTMNNLNEVVSIQTNINPVVEQLNLNKYITKTIEVLRNQIVKNEVEIINTVPDSTTVYFNPAYLESVLLNFLSNSIRYKHPDKKPLIKLHSYAENNYIVLEISDNGIGIDLKKNGKKLFGLYKTFTKNIESRGIGLFITKNQVDTMKGKIEVESSLNEGTTFKIYFNNAAKENLHH